MKGVKMIQNEVYGYHHRPVIVIHLLLLLPFMGSHSSLRLLKTEIKNKV